MMALKTCNASVFHYVEGTKKKLEELDLNSYPGENALDLNSYLGENVTDLASEAQQLLKIMSGLYAVQLNTGSTLLMNKLMDTSSSKIFNRKIFALLDRVMTLPSSICHR